MPTNETLKRNARAQLGGSIFASEWLALLVCGAIFSVILGASSATVIVYILLSGPLNYGMARITAKKACGEDYKTEELFCAFNENKITEIILLGFIRYLFVALWSLLFIVPGIVKSYSYSMAFYIMQEDPNKDWKQCLDESTTMMNGYRWQLFCIDVTMYLWYIAGAMCCGIGTLFVTPYKQMTHANFYLARKAELTNTYTTQSI